MKCDSIYALLKAKLLKKKKKTTLTCKKVFLIKKNRNSKCVLLYRDVRTVPLA